MNLFGGEINNMLSSELLFEILKELKIIRAHLEILTGEKFEAREKYR